MARRSVVKISQSMQFEKLGIRCNLVPLYYFTITEPSSGQSYKPSTLVNYESRVVTLSNLLVVTTVEL